MPRHNRGGEGRDQRGFRYLISYQPDWLRRIAVTRSLASGRQSTKTLFRNPSSVRQTSPGKRVRTRITSLDQGIDVEIAVTGARTAVTRVQIACHLPSGHPATRDDQVVFTLEIGLPPPPWEGTPAGTFSGATGVPNGDT